MIMVRMRKKEKVKGPLASCEPRALQLLVLLLKEGSVGSQRRGSAAAPRATPPMPSAQLGNGIFRTSALLVTVPSNHSLCIFHCFQLLFLTKMTCWSFVCTPNDMLRMVKLEFSKPFQRNIPTGTRHSVHALRKRNPSFPNHSHRPMK